LRRRPETVLEDDPERHPGALGGDDDRLGGGGRPFDRLLEQHRLAGGDRPGDDLGPGVRRRQHDDRADLGGGDEGAEVGRRR
jgi:hypothetical protein